MSAKEQGTRCASDSVSEKGRVPCTSPAGAPLLTSLCKTLQHSLSSALVVRRDTVHSTSGLFLAHVHFYKAEQPLLLAHAVVYPELQRRTTFRPYAAVQPSYTTAFRLVHFTPSLTNRWTGVFSLGRYTPGVRSSGMRTSSLNSFHASRQSKERRIEQTRIRTRNMLRK